MIETETLKGMVSHAQLTSQLNRAQTPQAVVCALVDLSACLPFEFDCCTLVLPAAGGQGLRVWRASHGQPPLSRQTGVDEACAQDIGLVAHMLSRGASQLIAASELQHHATEHFGKEAKSAMALPLSAGGQCFGMICFASERENVYTPEDMAGLAWLADHVAAVAQALLLRAQLETNADAQHELDRLKSGFVNTLVRDVRLPLTSVLGLLELFESKLQAREMFDAEDRQLLTSAIKNGDRMKRLLDDHLEVARQHERPLALNTQDININGLLEGIVDPLRGEAALRGVELNVQTNTHGLSINVDTRQTRRALCHLLAAALEATPDGGIVNIEAQEIKGTRVGDVGRSFVIINITDSGEGLPAEEVPYVFDAFWQAPGSHNAGNQGVGLAIAKRIAAAHGGNVAVRSQMGLGTVYSIVLPSSYVADEATDGRVLVVDDVPEIMLLLGKLVERMGYQVETAGSAEEALGIVEQKKIDLLITDWAMPGMSGGELIAHIKQDERWSEMPCIVLTGHDTEIERNDAMLAGCDRFLVKPVKRDELQRVICEMLGSEKKAKGEAVTSEGALTLPL